MFVEIPLETSVSRAIDRHRLGMEDFRAGKGQGGRYVPPAVIRSHASPTASSKNREVFDSLRDRFGRWRLFDNSGDFNPILLESSEEETIAERVGERSSAEEIEAAELFR